MKFHAADGMFMPHYSLSGTRKIGVAWQIARYAYSSTDPPRA